MITLYDRDVAINPYKVRLLLGFLGVAYDRIPVDRKDGRNIVDADYLELNPRGQIPTLVDADVTLWGSTAILIHLAGRYDPARTWWPQDSTAAARCAQWLELAQNEIQNGLFLVRAITLFGYPGDLDAARRAGKTALRVLDHGLKTSPWLAGAVPTIADIACFPLAASAPASGFDLSAMPAIQAWIERFRALPGFQEMPAPQ